MRLGLLVGIDVDQLARVEPEGPEIVDPVGMVGMGVRVDHRVNEIDLGRQQPASAGPVRYRPAHASAFRRPQSVRAAANSACAGCAAHPDRRHPSRCRSAAPPATRRSPGSWLSSEPSRARYLIEKLEEIVAGRGRQRFVAKPLGLGQNLCSFNRIAGLVAPATVRRRGRGRARRSRPAGGRAGISAAIARSSSERLKVRMPENETVRPSSTPVMASARPDEKQWRMAGKAPFPISSGQDFGHVVVGFARMDDQRQLGHARRRNVAQESLALRFAGRIIVVIVEPDFADGDHRRVFGHARQIVGGHVQLFIARCADGCRSNGRCARSGR